MSDERINPIEEWLGYLVVTSNVESSVHDYFDALMFREKEIVSYFRAELIEAMRELLPILERDES